MNLKRVFREIAVLAISALLVAIMWEAISAYSSRSKSPPPTHRIVAGERLNLEGVSFAAKPVTVILVTSPDCPHCVASEPFHRELLAYAESHEVPLYVLLPNPRKAGDYLRELGVLTREARPVTVLKPSVNLTPTLLLVDDEALVRRVFTGELAPDRQTEVLRVLSDPQRLKMSTLTTTKGTEELTRENLTRFERSRGNVILDVQERDEFARGHDPNAINIPLEELGVRAAFELERANLHVIDCTVLKESTCGYAANALTRQGFKVAEINGPSVSQ